MKAHHTKTSEPPFQSVSLILETQQEVDGLYDILNHRAITKQLGFDDNSFEALLPFTENEHPERSIRNRRLTDFLHSFQK